MIPDFADRNIGRIEGSPLNHIAQMICRERTQKPISKRRNDCCVQILDNPPCCHVQLALITRFSNARFLICYDRKVQNPQRTLLYFLLHQNYNPVSVKFPYFSKEPGIACRPDRKTSPALFLRIMLKTFDQYNATKLLTSPGT